MSGRTAKQIDAAKRAQTARLGQSGAHGKRKRCKKGKSCGASCIRNNYVCMVDIPWASSSGLGKLAKGIKNRPRPEGSKFPVPKPPKPESPKPIPSSKPQPQKPAKPQGQGPFRAPEIPAPPKPKPSPKPKGPLGKLREKYGEKVKRIIAKLREKGVPVERIKKELEKLKAQGFFK